MVWARIVVAVFGLFNALAGAALLLLPEWFFSNVAPFAPYNRHFMADIGAFNLPIGLGLLWAAYRPPQYFALLSLGLWANFIHVFNHFYDDWVLEGSLNHVVKDGLPLLLSTLALLVAYLKIKGEINGNGSHTQRA